MLNNRKWMRPGSYWSGVRCQGWWQQKQNWSKQWQGWYSLTVTPGITEVSVSQMILINSIGVECVFTLVLTDKTHICLCQYVLFLWTWHLRNALMERKCSLGLYSRINWFSSGGQRSMFTDLLTSQNGALAQWTRHLKLLKGLHSGWSTNWLDICGQRSRTRSGWPQKSLINH